ncbi:MAG TPA: RNA polymerase sigma factor [Planctomycetota bacterium]|jgi:RNA polymerase sigma factor (sigma-70 family)
MPATDYNAQSDGALLAQFAATRSDAPFEELIRRHGTMVYNVCFRALGQSQDAEDATQAVFIILGRKASSLTSRASVAGWLCLVARNVAQRAKEAANLRQAREKEAEAMKAAARGTPEPWTALRDCLDEEICALPEKYRLPIVLHHLEGNSTTEVARLLNCDESTLRSRLSRGRDLLNTRLARRGMALSLGLLAALISQNASAAAPPAGFAAATAKVVAASVVGHAVAGGVVSAKVAALAHGGLQALFYAKLKSAALVLLGLALTGSVAGVAVSHAKQNAPAQQTTPASAPAGLASAGTEADATAASKPKKLPGPSSGRATITGVVKALRDPKGKPDPAMANATLTATFTDEDGQAVQVVYFVRGWAGAILAKDGDGKKAEVSGSVSEEDGKRTIVGKSVEAKIIVVEEKSDR